MDIAEEKRRARGEAAKRRAAAHAALHETAKRALAERGLPLVRGPQQMVVSGFFPYKSEISTLPLLKRLAGEGWFLAMPVVMGEGLPLIFRAWAPGEPTVPGIWNIPVPPETAPEVLPDVLLVPMLAFDRLGYRLGYGGGFYDHTLVKLRALKKVVAIGVAYADQEVAAVPRAPYDQPLDFIMTEKDVFACG
ncbi:MAG: 5-formyltetrahydrofolate cyclo-ligase [Rhizobiales bacterium]|nr:5-formyltetrahydrofolate cyclo-ligase [Hyphomicrobiales bacterium]MBI3672132.1 5-formyltetrahydrofolate cyclo-ligase [Hyphomicrobiales bacterium]